MGELRGAAKSAVDRIEGARQQRFGGVDLDDDFRLEVAAGVIAEELVVAAGEAIDAGVLAAASYRCTDRSAVKSALAALR